MANNLITKLCAGGCGRKMRHHSGKCPFCRGKDAARWNEFAAEKQSASWKDTRKSLRPPSDEKMRACLSCGCDFCSDGPGNRICGGCKLTGAWRSADGVGHHVGIRRDTSRGAQ